MELKKLFGGLTKVVKPKTIDCLKVEDEKDLEDSLKPKLKPRSISNIKKIKVTGNSKVLEKPQKNTFLGSYKHNTEYILRVFRGFIDSYDFENKTKTKNINELIKEFKKDFYYSEFIKKNGTELLYNCIKTYNEGTLNLILKREEVSKFYQNYFNLLNSMVKPDNDGIIYIPIFKDEKSDKYTITKFTLTDFRAGGDITKSLETDIIQFEEISKHQKKSDDKLVEKSDKDISHKQDLGEFLPEETKIRSSLKDLDEESLKMSKKMISEYHKIPEYLSTIDILKKKLEAQEKINFKIQQEKKDSTAKMKSLEEITKSHMGISNLTFKNLGEVREYLVDLSNQIKVIGQEKENWKKEYDKIMEKYGKGQETILNLNTENSDLTSKIELLQKENNDLNESFYDLQAKHQEDETNSDKVKRILFNGYKQLVNIYEVYLPSVNHDVDPEYVSDLMIEDKNLSNSPAIIEMVAGIDDANEFAQKLDTGEINPSDCIENLGTQYKIVKEYAKSQKDRGNKQDIVLSDLSQKFEGLLNHLSQLNDGQDKVHYLEEKSLQ